jgi:hypothetical protein
MKPQPRHQSVLGEDLERLGLSLANLDLPGLSMEQMGYDTVAAGLGVLADAVVTVDEHGSSGLSAGLEGLLSSSRTVEIDCDRFRDFSRIRHTLGAVCGRTSVGHPALRGSLPL